jgi:DNA-directed RNA polymerase I, II, and III subunit RPABC2
MSYFNEIEGGGIDFDDEIEGGNGDLEEEDLDEEIEGGGEEDLEEDLEDDDLEIEGDGDLEEDEDLDEDLDEMEGGAGGDDLEEGEIEEDDNLSVNEEKETNLKKTKVKKIPSKTIIKKNISDENDDSEDDEDGEIYLKKFDREINKNYILNFHPECSHQNYDEILAMTKVVRDNNNIIIDELHRTIPYLTKYEKARILGQRAKQINSGATPFVKVPENVIDGYLIAELELQQKIIPFIIRRPLPNGGSEYWSIKDLEDISF